MHSTKIPPAPRARLRARLGVAAVLAALCAACGGAGTSIGVGLVGGIGGGNGGSAAAPAAPATPSVPAVPSVPVVPWVPPPSSGPPAQSGAVVVLAGDATASGSTDDQGAAARFNGPRGLVADAAGNLYVADEFNYVIRKVTPDGLVTTFAGLAGASGSIDGAASQARFTLPTALAIDSAGNLYVADGLSIRKLTPAGVVSTIATIDLPDNADGRSLAQFVSIGLARTLDGTLYVTNSIDTRRISTASQTTLLEGPAALTSLTNPKLIAPRGVAVDSVGNAYVGGLNKTVGRASATATALTVLAGSAGQTGSADGIGAAARFSNPVGLAVDGAGNLVVADAGNNLIRKIAQDGTVGTLAGTAGSTTLKPGQPGSLADLGGVTVDAGGVVYATSGNAIVKLVP